VPEHAPAEQFILEHVLPKMLIAQSNVHGQRAHKLKAYMAYDDKATGKRPPC
jgi:hypothetical protein